MKRSISNIVWCVFVTTCILWSIKYVISMTDYCGIDISSGAEYTVEALRELLPEKSAATLQDYGNAFAFLNRFGNPVVLYVEPYQKLYGVTYYLSPPDIRIQCYNKRFISKTPWCFIQLTPDMTVGEVISRVGLPEEVIYTGQKWVDWNNNNYLFGTRAAYYTTVTGKQYMLQWIDAKDSKPWICFYLKHHRIIKESNDDIPWSTVSNVTRLHSVYDAESDSTTEGSWEEIKPVPVYLTLSAGAITAGIILFRLKKKGLLCKKKQVQEQSDSSI